MLKLKKLLEKSLGKVFQNIKIVVDIETTTHGSERQFRHDTEITDKEIVDTAKLALGIIGKMLLYDKIYLEDELLIKDTNSHLNLIARMSSGRGGNLELVIITVIRKENFKVKKPVKKIIVV